MALFRRVVAATAALCVLATSLPVMAQPVPSPAMVTTEEAMTGSVQQRVGELLTRAEVRAALAARGVDAAQVDARVAALTDSEARQVAEQRDRLPAGASDILGILFAVFIILLITDILGLTKIFPFTRPVK
ncbi:MAG TPA: PA2779 family protein [Burkholderiaceae bacterium]|nr:PA2779 family protein [Burkholderiaceae bacterium]